MPKRSRKKRLDLNKFAASIIDEAVTEELLQKATEEGKNFAAVLLGRQGGLKGGKIRASRLSAQKRSEIARKAALARWSKAKKKK
jgi:hypothetical protein